MCPGLWGLRDAASSTAFRGRSQIPNAVHASGLSVFGRSIGGLGPTFRLEQANCGRRTDKPAFNFRVSLGPQPSHLPSRHVCLFLARGLLEGSLGDAIVFVLPLGNVGVPASLVPQLQVV